MILTESVYHKLSLIGYWRRCTSLIECNLSASCTPCIGGQVIVVVNLLNHELVRGRTSSAAPHLKEDVIALGAQSPTPVRRSVLPTLIRYFNVTRESVSAPPGSTSIIYSVGSEELAQYGVHLHRLLLLDLLVGPQDYAYG